jgi:hypothetical protein
MKIHIIVTVFNRITPLKRLIYDFLLQTSDNWTLTVVHDGPAPKEIVGFISSLRDERISFRLTPVVNGHYGFPNRQSAMAALDVSAMDYVLHTNDDNQYLRVFVEYFLTRCGAETGLVYCNTLHSYLEYDLLYTKVRVRHIDMGSFIVRLDVAKKIGFSQLHEQADGVYAEECASECARQRLKIIQINKALFIHN